MKKSKLGYLIIAFLLVWVLAQFFFLPAICSAEPVYMITETELVTLEQNSNRQLEISSQLAQELQTAKKTVESIGEGIDRSQTAERAAAEAVNRAGSLVEESRNLSERNLEIIAAIRARGASGDWSED